MTLTGELLEEIDDQRYRWTLICPTCLINFSGAIHKTGWLQLDAVCPGCQRTIAGFTNPCWPLVDGANYNADIVEGVIND